jgi:hypothetical protein
MNSVDPFTIFTKNAFFLVGCDGEGEAAEAQTWIPPLWREFEQGRSSLEKLALRDERGRMPIWGAMTDTGHTFQPWGDEGKYMVGIESDKYLDAVGFAVWRIPGFRYVRVEATLATYAEVFRNTLGTLLPQFGFDLVGAVQEYYLKDRMWLLFPIERLHTPGE